MKTKFHLIVGLAATLMAARGAEALPSFSWEHVPVYAHLGKTAGDFTTEELDFLARHFNFIALEKGQAFRQRGSTEAGFAEAARQLKQRNPRAQLLFYWNAFLDYPLYAANKTFPAGGHLQDAHGKPVLVRNTVPSYDLARADVRAWWSDVAAANVRAGAVEGIFADALQQVIAPAKQKLLGAAKYKALNEGLVTLLQDARRKLGPEKLIIYNGLRNGEGTQFLPLTSGAMIEHFGALSGTGKEKMAADMESMQQAARAGKIICLKAWPGFTWLDADVMKKPHAELARLAREHITFPLACFLAAAGTNSFFCYTWGYREGDGTFEWYPEFDKPLGPPQGEARRDGWIWRREFAHAAVSVNLETQAAKIDWH